MTADLAISSVGADKFVAASNEIFKIAFVKHKENPVVKNISIYTYDYKTVILAVNKSVSMIEFIDFIKQLHHEYSCVKISGVTVVSRFVVTAINERPLERALVCLASSKSMDDTFVVCDATNKDELSCEFVAMDHLSDAIKNTSVIPHYQGIRNNLTGKIDKYEALMRIKDQYGNLHSPFHFMRASLKYNLYSILSIQMVEKVLFDFRNRKESVSINISMRDIATPRLRDDLLALLKGFVDPGRLIIEIIETENALDDPVILSFVADVRKIGCKVAIDDFGSGYSNFELLLKIKPDFIKIDGSIIKDVAVREDAQTLLDVIASLARRLGAKAIAEFVESNCTQEKVVEYGVPYSQGYLYAKPTPIEYLP